MRVDDFHGAKAALFIGDRIVVLQRDRIQGLAWPGAIDLPGGGREGDETPEACVTREIEEETGLALSEGRLRYRKRHSTVAGQAWFFAALLTEKEAAGLRLGDEGEAIWLMLVADYLSSDEVIAHHKPLVFRTGLAD